MTEAAKSPTMDAAYMSGFGNEFATEALPGALPVGQNSPQRAPYGLYAEQLSGSAFTAPRGTNKRSWLYRIRPSVLHAGAMADLDMPLFRSAPTVGESSLPLHPLRWDPTPPPEEETTFLTGMRTMTTGGDVATHTGYAIHTFAISRSMIDDYFYSADGEFLVVAEQGSLVFHTELGQVGIRPGEVAVIPRGIKFRVALDSCTAARGYVCENYGTPLTLPERGPIGANGLANPRDFLSPVAAWEDKDGADCTLTIKWCGRFQQCHLNHSPLDVVAWHGNFAPYKYDLDRFSPVGAILNDHPDPSIFTVLTSPTAEPGTANVDFVIFPPRWLVAEDTFRPPWYHMNVMSEFMGLIHGVYDAKPEGFVPGGMSLHNCMLPHGPDHDAFNGASWKELGPEKLGNTMAFMFETRLPQHLTRFASELPSRQERYFDCWRGLERNFDPARRARSRSRK
ncbi:MAG: homogentisate 1,2-dioxygenase [Minwuia sp.]|nr:homogentisate 1,2-dioxygenase [Minwuia sp.]